MDIIPVDFETKKIEKRPKYPPDPVGVAVKIDRSYEYLAWGHPTGNNIKKIEAKKILKEVNTKHVPLYHNAAFDIYVGVHKLKVPYPRKGFHDTLFLAYLNDPRDTSLSLKPLAEKYLGMPPEEQLELREWILENTECKDTKEDPWGGWISEAPGELVGKYAKGDIIRTEKLFEYFMPVIEEWDMSAAYDRERYCMPVFEDMSHTGICVAVNKLKRDLRQWEKQQAERVKWIQRRLKTPDLDLAKGKQLANALEKTGKISHWIMTKPSKTFPKGQRSTAKENLMKVCTDKKLVEELGRHSVLNTYISTFAKSWIESAEKYDGRIYPSFNQVRSTDEYNGGSKGTRTGRPSSNNPNLLNVPRNQEDPLLPNMRDYLIPDPGMVFIIYDYNQQELRITAHYEEGSLFHAYTTDPSTDGHVLAGNLIEQAVGVRYPRKHIKIVNFGVVYGMGRPGTAKKIEGTEEEAGELLKAHALAFPDIKKLGKNIQDHCRKGEPIVTWGGRIYYAEEPKSVKIGNRLVRKDFYYKQLNYLVQGSAADCTKEAMIRTDRKIRKIGGRIVLQVYDELVVCVPKDKAKEGAKIVKEAMESVEFDVPMLVDGKIGRISWGQAVKIK